MPEKRSGTDRELEEVVWTASQVASGDFSCAIGLSKFLIVKDPT